MANETTSADSKRSSHFVYSTLEESGAIVGIVINSKTENGAGEEIVRFRFSEMPASSNGEATSRGYGAKLLGNVGPAKIPNYADAVVALRETFDLVKSGQWNAEREGGVSRDLVAAYATVAKISEEKARKKLDALTAQERKLVAAHKGVAAELSKLVASRSKTDTKALFGELGI